MWMKKVVEKVDGTDEEEDAARKAEREAERAREEAERIRKEAERQAEQEAEEAEREAEREEARAAREEMFKPQDGELGSFERRPVRPVDESSPDMAALRALAQPDAVPARVAAGAAFSRARRDQFPPGLDAALREQGNTDSTIQSAPFSEPLPNVLGTPPSRPQAGRPMQEGEAPVERAPRVPRGVTLMTPEQEQAQLERFGLQNPWSEPQTPAAPPRTPNVNMEIGDITTTPTARVLEDEITTTPTPPAPNLVQEQVQLDREQRQPVLGELERRPVLPVAEGDMRQRELDRIQQRAAVVSNQATPQPQLPENRTPTSGTTAPMGETPPSGMATPVEAGEGVVNTPASAPTGGSLSPRRVMTQDELNEATASLARDPRGMELIPPNETVSSSASMERTGVLPLEPSRGIEFPESRLGGLKDEDFTAPSITKNTLSPQSEEPLSAEEEIARAQRRERIFRILRAIGAIGSGIAVGATAAAGRNPAFLSPIIRGLGGALGQAQPVDDTRARLVGRQMDERTATQARELDLNELRQQAALRQAELQRAQQQEQFESRESRLAGATAANLERSRMQLEMEAEARNPESAMSRAAQEQVRALRDALPERFQARFPDSAIGGLNVEQAERMASAIYSLVDERGGSVAGGAGGSSVIGGDTGRVEGRVSPSDARTEQTDQTIADNADKVEARAQAYRQKARDAQRFLRAWNQLSDTERRIVTTAISGGGTLESLVTTGSNMATGVMASAISAIRALSNRDLREQSGAAVTDGEASRFYAGLGATPAGAEGMEDYARNALQLAEQGIQQAFNNATTNVQNRLRSTEGSAFYMGSGQQGSGRQWVVRDQSGAIRGRRNSPPTTEETERLTGLGYTVEEAQ